jgi:hypothetical protein
MSNNETRSCNHFCRGKALSITYSNCVSVALVIQHAISIILPFVAGLSATFFYIISKRHYFRKRLLNVKCVLIFSTRFV